jgi:hypothetical protein
VLQNIYALGRQAQALRAPVPQLGVTFHRTLEDLANIEARRLVEREYVLLLFSSFLDCYFCYMLIVRCRFSLIWLFVCLFVCLIVCLIYILERNSNDERMKRNVVQIADWNSKYPPFFSFLFLFSFLFSSFFSPLLPVISFSFLLY